MKNNNWKRILLDLNLTKEERIQAAFHLENTGDDESVRVMGKALFSEPSPIVRHEIAFSLGETSHPNLASKYLIKAIETDKNVFVVHEALLALATLGKKEFIPFIEKYLGDSRPEISESAEIALQRIMQTGD